MGWGSSDKCCPSPCLISSLREEVARFLSFYCKSPAPLKPENVSKPPPLLSPALLPTSPYFGLGRGSVGLGSALRSVLSCLQVELGLLPPFVFPILDI